MRLLFLDFDGVINSGRYLRSPAFKKETEKLTDAELYLIKYEYMIDREAIQLVNDLVSRSGATVILSSSHRTRYSLEEINKMLKGRGATFEVVGKTPRLLPKKFSMHVERGEEIQAFLDSLCEPPESFVILDDMNDMLHLTQFLVRTYDSVGLQSEHIEKALKILNGEKI